MSFSPSEYNLITRLGLIYGRSVVCRVILRAKYLNTNEYMKGFELACNDRQENTTNGLYPTQYQ